MKAGREAGSALLVALRAPWRQWKLALPLWLARLLPILLFFFAWAFHHAAEHSASHPDAGYLINPEGDEQGFVYNWTQDLFRDIGTEAGDRIFWMVLLAWVLTLFLSGGIVARLVRVTPGPRGFLEECGRYAGRFLRLGLLVAFLGYVVSVGIDTFLRLSHEAAEETAHTQDMQIQHAILRGALLLFLLELIGLVHGYARIRIVAQEGHSAFLAFVRGFWMWISRFPRLFLLELGLLLLRNAAIVFAWFLASVLAPKADVGGVGLTLFLVALLLGSYFRTAFEVGVIAARVRALEDLLPAPPVVLPEEPSPSAPQAEGPGDWLELETPGGPVAEPASGA